MLKGAKKAIVRAPHRFIGSKSIEDRIIIEWSKDFVTADEALSQVVRETKKFVATWRDICDSQQSLALTLRELYEPIRDENAYRVVQETPESSLTAVAQYSEFVGGALKEAIDPYLQTLEGPFSDRIKSAQECLKGVQKLLTKREHKKVDFDRHSNGLEKLLKKRHGGEPLSEKEQAAQTKQEQDLEAATEVFHEIDEKVKTTVPYVLTYMSEFLNPMTASLYLTQLKVFEEAQRILATFAQPQGLSGNLVSTGTIPGSTEQTESPSPTREPSLAPLFTGEPSDYVNIMDSWEARYQTIQPRYEHGIETLRNGKTVQSPIGEERLARRQKATERAQEKTKNTAQSGIHAAQGLAHKAFGFIPNKYVKDIHFSSPELGFFQTEADLLQVAASSAGGEYETASPPPYGSSGSASAAGAGAAATTAAGFGAGFSFFRRSPPTMSGSAPSKAGGSLPARSPSMRSTRTMSITDDTGLGFSYGRSPVTSYAFEDAAAQAQQEREAREALRTRVRVSMSTTARTYTIGDEIANRLRSRDKENVHRKPAGENERGLALFTFTGQEAGDVAFKAGDEIKILDHGDDADDQWWFGETVDGRMGLFPQAYVRVL